MNMPNSRVGEIDLLRFFAAISVVFFHYSFRSYAAGEINFFPYAALSDVSKYGYLGVELFFIISGFVILMSAARGNFRDFFISRVVRLYPAFWICCSLTFLVIVFWGGPKFSFSFSDYLVNMTMLGGFLGFPSIDGSYWSLFIELRFYALVSFVLLIGKVRHAQSIVIAWLILSIILEFYPIRILRSLFVVNYSAFFIAGAMYFIIWSKGLSFARILAVVASWLLAIYRSIEQLPDLNKSYGVHFDPFIVAGIISAFFVSFFFIVMRQTGVFGRRDWGLAGSLTYPLYLIHQKIGVIVFSGAYEFVNLHILFWGVLAAVLLLSYLICRFVERPLMARMKSALQVFLVRLGAHGRARVCV